VEDPYARFFILGKFPPIETALPFFFPLRSAQAFYNEALVHSRGARERATRLASREIRRSRDAVRGAPFRDLTRCSPEAGNTLACAEYLRASETLIEGETPLGSRTTTRDVSAVSRDIVALEIYISSSIFSSIRRAFFDLRRVFDAETSRGRFSACRGKIPLTVAPPCTSARNGFNREKGNGWGTRETDFVLNFYYLLVLSAGAI